MRLIKEIYEYREMIFSLVRKELRGRYKGSVLGFLWTFINPLLQLVVYTIVFAFLLKSDIEKYYLFLFVALVPWLFFNTSVTGGATCILAQKDLVKKIYFPRQVLPIAYVTTAFVNMLLCFIVIFGVIAVSGVGISIKALCFLPIVMFVEFIMALGITMLTSALTVYFRDLEHILGIVTMAWMYMTPIMYDVVIIPEKYRAIFSVNPMAPVIMAYRDILYSKQIPHITTLTSGLIFGVATLIIGWFTFNKLQKRFVEEL